MGAGIIMNDSCTEVLPPMGRFMQDLVRDSSPNLTGEISCKEETASTTTTTTAAAAAAATATPATTTEKTTDVDASLKSVLDFDKRQTAKNGNSSSSCSVTTATTVTSIASLGFDMSKLVLVSDNARVFAKARPKQKRSNKDLLSSQSWHSSRELRQQFTADARWGRSKGVGDSSISPPLSSRRNVAFGNPTAAASQRSHHQRSALPIRRRTSDSCLSVPTRDWMQQSSRRQRNDQPPRMIRSNSAQEQHQHQHQHQQRQPLVASRFAASVSPLETALRSSWPTTRLPPLSASSDDNDDDSVDSFSSFSEADLVAAAAAMVQSMPSSSGQQQQQQHGNRRHRDSIQVVHRAKSKAHLQQQQEQQKLQQQKQKQRRQHSMRRPKTSSHPTFQTISKSRRAISPPSHPTFQKISKSRRAISPPPQPLRYKECSPSSNSTHSSPSSYTTSIPQSLSLTYDRLRAEGRSSLFAETFAENPSNSGSERSEGSSRFLGRTRSGGGSSKWSTKRSKNGSSSDSKKKSTKPASIRRSSSSSSSSSSRKNYLNSGSNHSIESLELALGDLAPRRRKDRGVDRARSSRY